MRCEIKKIKSNSFAISGALCFSRAEMFLEIGTCENLRPGFLNAYNTYPLGWHIWKDSRQFEIRRMRSVLIVFLFYWLFFSTTLYKSICVVLISISIKPAIVKLHLKHKRYHVTWHSQLYINDKWWIDIL